MEQLSRRNTSLFAFAPPGEPWRDVITTASGDGVASCDDNMRYLLTLIINIQDTNWTFLCFTLADELKHHAQRKKSNIVIFHQETSALSPGLRETFKKWRTSVLPIGPPQTWQDNSAPPFKVGWQTPQVRYGSIWFWFIFLFLCLWRWLQFYIRQFQKLNPPLTFQNCHCK